MAAHQAPPSLGPSGCLAAQTKRWAEGIRVPGPLAGEAAPQPEGCSGFLLFFQMEMVVLAPVVMVTVRMMGMKRIMAPSLSMTRSDGL